MAWIRTIDQDHATDDLKVFYKKHADPFTGIENIWKAHSLNPTTLRFHFDLFKEVSTGRSNLSRMQREMIGVVVSSANRCAYGVKHHGKDLFALTKNPFLLKAMEGDFHAAEIPRKDIAMLEYARKLTLDPGGVEKADVDALRDAGFKDVDILDIALLTAYVNLSNRVATGLGVEIEKSLKSE